MRFPEGDRGHDALLEEQIRDAVAWVSNDTSIDLAELEAGDPLLPAIAIAVIIVVRSIYDGIGIRPKSYEIIAGPLRASIPPNSGFPARSLHPGEDRALRAS